jgi:hypothetical protein
MFHFNVNNAIRLSHSFSCYSVAGSIFRFVDVFRKILLPLKILLSLFFYFIDVIASILSCSFNSFVLVLYKLKVLILYNTLYAVSRRFQCLLNVYFQPVIINLTQIRASHSMLKPEQWRLS